MVVVNEQTEGGCEICNDIRHLTDTGRLADVRHALTSDCLLATEVGVRLSHAHRLVSPPSVSGLKLLVYEALTTFQYMRP